MNLPDKIKIGPYDIKVEIVHNIAIDRDHGGEYSPRELTISLDSSIEKRHGEIFVHEIVEAINDIYNLNINHDDMMVLGVALYQVLKENRLTF
jgi:hypothetical protein